MAIRAAVRFSPFGKHTLVGGADVEDSGSNDPDILWTGGSRPWRTTNAASLWEVKGPNFSGPETISAIAKRGAQLSWAQVEINDYYTRNPTGQVLSNDCDYEHQDGKEPQPGSPTGPF